MTLYSHEIILWGMGRLSLSTDPADGSVTLTNWAEKNLDAYCISLLPMRFLICVHLM